MIWTQKDARIDALEKALQKAQRENDEWYRKGVNAAAAIIEADGLEALKELVGSYRHCSDLSYTLSFSAKSAEARLKQRAEDEALLERITPLLEERFATIAKKRKS